ncbi:MAG TPA: murein L,D-transpeptidase catalytic domain family protein [Puia sp.]|nr:murein L,D-transpeptidase catalytic domain family protein [Puia sp.]
MKLLTYPIAKIFLVLFFLITSVTTTQAGNDTYHAADAIKTILRYTVSASSVVARTVEMEKAASLAASLKAAEMQKAIKLAAYKTEYKMVMTTALSIYDRMDLEDSGLSRKAFEYAWLGYHNLLKKGVLHRSDVLTVCDFSQSSSQQRMYVIDVRNKKMLYRTYVAHGINSGEEYANSFSNSPESCKSSLGFYVTRKTYFGSNGLSLRIDGVDKGFNDMANKRNIVIHGAPYVSLRILHKYGVMGTTFGCPAVPTEASAEIIPMVKNGTCFFIYYPSKKYLAQSKVLNSI